MAARSKAFDGRERVLRFMRESPPALRAADPEPFEIARLAADLMREAGDASRLTAVRLGRLLTVHF